MKSIYSLFTILFLLSCGPTTKKVSILSTATPLPPDAEVKVIGTGEKVPEGAKLLGNLKIGDGNTLAKNCTYVKVVADAQEQARGIGGNLIQITKHKEPDLGSTCHRLWCDVYFVKPSGSQQK